MGGYRGHAEILVFKEGVSEQGVAVQWLAEQGVDEWWLPEQGVDEWWLGQLAWQDNDENCGQKGDGVGKGEGWGG